MNTIINTCNSLRENIVQLFSPLETNAISPFSYRDTAKLIFSFLSEDQLESVSFVCKEWKVLAGEVLEPKIAEATLREWKCLATAIGREEEAPVLENYSTPQAKSEKARGFAAWKQTHATALKKLAARDTFIVWRELAEEIDAWEGVLVYDEVEPEELMEGFSRWLEEHRKKLSSITHFSLQWLGLYSIPTKFFEYLPRLKVLSLEGNKLISIPRSIAQCTDLTSLDACNNQLVRIPDMERLTKLEALLLHRNQLTWIPASLGTLTNLQNLHLEHNALSSIPNALGKLTRLRILCLEHNALSSIPNALGELTRLRILCLNSNPLTEIPAWIHHRGIKVLP